MSVQVGPLVTGTPSTRLYLAMKVKVVQSWRVSGVARWVATVRVTVVGE